MSPGASAQVGMHLACLHQAGARHGSRASAVMGIQGQSLILYVTINYLPMQKQSGCIRKSIRSVMNPPSRFRFAVLQYNELQ
jgi:hypothetical protein